MDTVKDLIAFLAIWFNNLKKHTFKVDAGISSQLASYNKDLARLDADLKGIIATLSKIETKDVTSELKAVLEKLVETTSREIVFPKINIPKEVSVANFPPQKEFPASIEVSNFPKPVDFPKAVEVSNFPKFPEPKDVVFPKVQKVTGSVSVENQLSLEEVIKGLQTVVDVINELRLELPKNIGSSVVASTSMAPKSPEYKTNHIDNTSQASTVYIGKETASGVWEISKLGTSSGVVKTYANPANNKNVYGYSSAWAQRLSLTYDIFSTAR